MENLQISPKADVVPVYDHYVPNQCVITGGLFRAFFNDLNVLF